MKYTEIFAVGGLVVSLALAYKLNDVARDNRNGMADASAEVRKGKVITEGLMAQAQQLRSGLTFSGVDVFSHIEHETQFGPIGSAVLYLFGTGCPHAPDNVPFLDSLHARGIPVVGIALDAALPDARGFAHMHQPGLFTTARSVGEKRVGGGERL